MIVKNEPRLCAIKIQCTQQDFVQSALGAITSVIIRRKADEELGFVTIGSVDIQTQDDLDFVVYDITARSNRAYKYYCIPTNGDTEGVGAVGEVESKFSALFVGNLSEQYVIALNAKYEHKLHYSMSFVQTYYRQFPHAVQNGNMKYSTGSVTGLFLDRDASGEFTKRGAQMYKEKVLNFLSDGNWKIIKTGEGHLWYAQIDGDLQENYSDFIGASTITFNWTEIGATTNEGIVVMS